MGDKVSMKDLVRKERELMGAGAERATAQPGDEFYTPPVANVPLPSRGKVYPPDSPLFNTDSLDVRAMVATDEDIMTSPGLLRTSRMISELMKACTVSRTIDADQMLTGDRNAIMIAIRNSSYGPEYAAEVVCPGCDKKLEHTFDLSRLSMKTLDVDPDVPAQNVFSCTLPVTKRKVQFRLQTAESQRELDAILEAQREAKPPGATEENVTQGLISQILTIQGVEDSKRARFIRNMPVRDVRFLRKHIDDISPAVEMKQEMSCPHCGKKAAVEVPLTAEFFWPKS